MDVRRIIEPAGLLFGAAAQRAVARGVALPLTGGPAAFALATLWEDGRATGPVPIDRIPPSWASELALVTTAPPLAGLPDSPMVMGILNVTPDSFSDGGRFEGAEAGCAQGRRMRAAGADILDIGAESTRPGAVHVSSGEEWHRLEPVVTQLANEGALVSVDTRNAATMRLALEAGAVLINDVSALQHDPEAAAMLAEQHCGVVLMHMRGTPETMNALTDYGDVALDVVRELAARVADAERAGIARERILVDPGLGFAKTADQNYELLARLPILSNLRCRVVLGLSRKRMIGTATGIEVPAERDPGSIAGSLPALWLRNALMRVHDAGGMTQAMRVWRAGFEGILPQT